MTTRACIIGLLYATVWPASAANAQELSRQVRFITASVAGDQQWQGYLERLTPDSLQLRVRGTDTIAAFSRPAVRSVERERVVNPGSAARVGCVTVGAALGALGFFGTHDPDSPGLEKTLGVLGLAVGCAGGAVGGLVVSATRSRG
jgi:hypothetical protein